MIKYQILMGFLLFIACISSCSVENTNKFNDIHPDLLPYVNNYKERLVIGGANKGDLSKIVLTAGFGSIGRDGVVGICKYVSDNRVEIELDTLYWKEMGSKSKTILIYHELTHCLCGRGHNHNLGTYPEAANDKSDLPDDIADKDLEKSGYFSDRCPVSLMHPRVPNAVCIDKHWNHYLGEMLNKCELIK